MKFKQDDRVTITDERAMHVHLSGKIAEVHEDEKYYDVAVDGVNSGLENYDDTQLKEEQPMGGVAVSTAVMPGVHGSPRTSEMREGFKAAYGAQPYTKEELAKVDAELVELAHDDDGTCLECIIQHRMRATIAERDKEVGRLRSVICEASGALFSILPLDVEHSIESHADGLPGDLRIAAAGVEKAQALLQVIVVELVEGGSVLATDMVKIEEGAYHIYKVPPAGDLRGRVIRSIGIRRGEGCLGSMKGEVGGYEIWLQLGLEEGRPSSITISGCHDGGPNLELVDGRELPIDKGIHFPSEVESDGHRRFNMRTQPQGDKAPGITLKVLVEKGMPVELKTLADLLEASLIHAMRNAGRLEWWVRPRTSVEPYPLPEGTE